MVAINLPLIAELSKKLSLYTNADKVANHLEDVNYPPPKGSGLVTAQS